MKKILSILALVVILSFGCSMVDWQNLSKDFDTSSIEKEIDNISEEVVNKVEEEIAKLKDSVSNIDIPISDIKDDVGTLIEENLGQSYTKISLTDIPEYSGVPYVVINGNVPDFSEVDKNSTKGFEEYSNLDILGRCGVAYANICKEIMPTEERGEIGSVKPSGWHTVKYDCIADKYLYNRCHLVGYQLSGENANEKNLITGTRYLNIEGMLPFENMIDAYVEETNHHVLYRVSPIFEGANLVASGVQLEAWSVEDSGEGICFNVYCYNVQPGVIIDYATGFSESASGN